MQHAHHQPHPRPSPPASEVLWAARTDTTACRSCSASRVIAASANREAPRASWSIPIPIGARIWLPNVNATRDTFPQRSPSDHRPPTDPVARWASLPSLVLETSLLLYGIRSKYVGVQVPQLLRPFGPAWPARNPLPVRGAFPAAVATGQRLKFATIPWFAGRNCGCLAEDGSRGRRAQVVDAPY